MKIRAATPTRSKFALVSLGGTKYGQAVEFSLFAWFFSRLQAELILWFWTSSDSIGSVLLFVAT
jgi:hypothetical protein